jgi:putative membrane-bound dehydrogenase-like protein
MGTSEGVQASSRRGVDSTAIKQHGYTVRTSHAFIDMNAGLDAPCGVEVSAARLQPQRPGDRFKQYMRLALAASILLSPIANAAESGPPLPAKPSTAPETGPFQIEKGFRIELVASEPMVTAPVAMAFDEDGRLFVVELRGGQSRGANLGRVRMLENMNEDGVFQNSTMYAEGLNWPSAIACYAGGVFVAIAPDVVYLKDTKHDGIADARQVVFSGFGGSNNLSSKFLPNNFNWGPDNRIHGSSGGIGGTIAANPGQGRISIAYADFSFDPKTLDFRAEAGPSESGLTFDSEGRRFTCSYVRPLMVPMFDLRYTARNPYYPKPAPLVMSADPWAPLYQFNVPARSSARTRVTNLVSAGFMRNARGAVVYRGRAFPTNYLNNAFIADPEAHLIRRLTLREDGLQVTAQRPVNELNTEFLISRDTSFRPVQVINGPDGALYVADMQDGAERGRIYRITPERLKRSKPPQLGKAKTYDLVSTIAQGDGWHRDTAARLVYERNDPAAPALLRGTLLHSRLAQGRANALQALAGLGALSEQDVIRALGDNDPEVRERAVRLAENLFRRGETSDALWAQFRALTQDSSPRVRYQLAFTLGELEGGPKAQLLAQILNRDPNNVWVQNAVLSSVANDAGELLGALVSSGGIRNDLASALLVQQLATMIGINGRQDGVTAVANVVSRNLLSPMLAYTCLYGLGDGLYRTRSSLPMVDRGGVLQPAYTSALGIATDASQPELARVAATRLLGVSSLGVGAVADWIQVVCNPPTTPSLQSAAVETLSRYDAPQLLNSILQMWPVLGQMARNRAISALLSRDGQVNQVLDALQSGSLPSVALSPAQRNFLRTYAYPQVRSQALRLLGPVPMSRPEVIAKFKPALSLQGAAANGAVIFRQRCAECHMPGGPGNASLGPALLRARSFSKDELLSSILEPNVMLRPDYATQVLESKEGQSLVGILADETPSTVTLKEPGGNVVVWPAANIRAIQTQNWSLMPDGLETGLSPQDLADLMEYIRTRSR